MERRSSPGFTIVETLLFLALSGLFLLIAFLGVGTRSGQVQFTDSMRSLQSYLQLLQNDTLNGVNARGANPDCNPDLISGTMDFPSDNTLAPGQSNCIIMGRIIYFAPDSPTAQVRIILGNILTSTARPSSRLYLDPDLSELELIVNSHPHIIHKTELNSTYSLEWQSTFQGGYNTGSNDVIGIGFLRSPASTNIYNFAVRDCIEKINTDRLDFDSNPPGCFLSLGESLDTKLCFKGANGQLGTIKIGGVQSDALEIKFDEACTP